MSFESALASVADSRDMRNDGARNGEPVCYTPRLASALEQLGPVVLVRRTSVAGAARWTLCHAVDSLGVREYLQMDRWRLYRLPDSDFLGWERLAALCGYGAPPDSRDRGDRRLRSASIALASNRQWQAVPRVSALGWQVTRDVLQLEAAHLCRAAWEH